MSSWTPYLRPNMMLCNRFMGAAILEQQEQQEKVDYKESFPTTPKTQRRTDQVAICN